MWDTSKDYRILVANHAREQCLNIIQTASFRGNWNKKLAIETAKNMIDRIAGNGWRVPSGIIPAEYRG